MVPVKMNEDFAFCGNQHLVLRGRIVPLALFLPLFHFEFKLTKAYYANDSLVIKVEHNNKTKPAFK